MPPAEVVLLPAANRLGQQRMTILVTGGTGFIGSAVVRRLLAHNHKIQF